MPPPQKLKPGRRPARKRQSRQPGDLAGKCRQVKTAPGVDTTKKAESKTQGNDGNCYPCGVWPVRALASHARLNFMFITVSTKRLAGRARKTGSRDPLTSPTSTRRRHPVGDGRQHAGLGKPPAVTQSDHAAEAPRLSQHGDSHIPPSTSRKSGLWRGGLLNLTCMA